MCRREENLRIEECKNSNDLSLVRMNAKDIVLSGPYGICDFAENVKLARVPEVMGILEDGMIQYDDIVHCYEFMFLMVDSGIESFNLPRFETLIKESKNPKLMAYSLAFVPGIDKESMCDSLYQTKCAKYIEKLSDPEYELNVNELKNYKKELASAKRYPYFPWSLRKFGTKDVNKLIEYAINSKDPYIVNEVADYIEYLRVYWGITNYDLTSLERAELYFTRDNPLHSYEYASSTEQCNKTAFETQVIEDFRAKYMYYFYEYVNGSNKERLKNCIALTNDHKYMRKVGYKI